jgi:small subunit ribosomal protein S15
MARMHSRKHGKSGSKKPLKKIETEWLIYDKEEVENLILKLAKKGHSSAEIGTILRDQYGIPDVREMGLRVSKVVNKEFKKEVPEDLYNLLKKAVNLHKHMSIHKKDAKCKHGLELTESKIRRLGKYYMKKGLLDKNWKYDIEKVKLMIK